MGLTGAKDYPLRILYHVRDWSTSESILNSFNVCTNFESGNIVMTNLFPKNIYIFYPVLWASIILVIYPTVGHSVESNLKLKKQILLKVNNNSTKDKRVASDHLKSILSKISRKKSLHFRVIAPLIAELSSKTPINIVSLKKDIAKIMGGTSYFLYPKKGKFILTLLSSQKYKFKPDNADLKAIKNFSDYTEVEDGFIEAEQINTVENDDFPEVAVEDSSEDFLY